jgi:pyrroline-5-carboxylate reductase
MIKFGTIGGGVMGEALLSRLIAQKVYLPSEILVSDPQLQRRQFLTETYGIGTTASNLEVAAATEVLFLAIKPQVFDTVALELAVAAVSQQGNNGETADSQPEALVVSILAGVPLSKLEPAFPGRGVLRVMPNTPATVGASNERDRSGKTCSTG